MKDGFEVTSLLNNHPFYPCGNLSVLIGMIGSYWSLLGFDFTLVVNSVSHDKKFLFLSHHEFLVFHSI